MPSKTKMMPLRMKPSVSQTPLACMRWRAVWGVCRWGRSDIIMPAMTTAMTAPMWIWWQMR